MNHSYDLYQFHKKSYLQEKFVFQEDLTIGNGDDVGWDVSGDITSLGFDDWKGGQGTSSEIVRDLGCTFQILRVRLTLPVDLPVDVFA